LLQVFAGVFVSSAPQNAYLEIRYTDINRRLSTLIVWWCFLLIGGAKITKPTQFTMIWPIAFRNEVLLPLIPYVVLSTPGTNGDPQPWSLRGVHLRLRQWRLCGSPCLRGFDPAGFLWLTIEL
jgi:hypothetical protein